LGIPQTIFKDKMGVASPKIMPISIQTDIPTQSQQLILYLITVTAVQYKFSNDFSKKYVTQGKATTFSIITQKPLINL